MRRKMVRRMKIQSRRDGSCGFTLVEILITLGVIALLAAIAFPLYKNYVIKASAVEGLEFADAMRIKVIEAQMESPDRRPGQIRGVAADKITAIAFLPNGNRTAPLLGGISVGMNLPHVGEVSALALEFFADGSWRCVAHDRFVADMGMKQDGFKPALDAAALPASCLPGASAMAAHPAAPAGCPGGAQPIQVPDAAGKMQMACPPPAAVAVAAPAPSAQPANPAPAGVAPKETMMNNVKYELQQIPPWPGSSSRGETCLRLAPGQNPPTPVVANPCPPGTVSSTANSRMAECRPISICPINPVAPNGKPDANTCPPGMIYHLAGAPPVGPSGLTSSYKLPKDWDNSRGVCLDPKNYLTYERQYGLRSPATAYKAMQCEVCSGPPVICENVHTTKACEWPMNVCVNELTNHADTGRQVVRGCGNEENAFIEWFQKYSANDKCVNFNDRFVYTAEFYCSYSCASDNCNKPVNPANKWTGTYTN